MPNRATTNATNLTSLKRTKANSSSGKIVKQVAASVVAPILIYGIKVAVGLSGQT